MVQPLICQLTWEHGEHRAPSPPPRAHPLRCLADSHLSFRA